MSVKQQFKPIEEMTNAEIYDEMQIVGAEMSRLEKLKSWDERNAFVTRWRELYRAYDFGFRIGEKVETFAWERKWQPATVINHDSDNYFFLKNDKGWEIIVSGSSIRKVAVVQETAGEQLALELF